MLNGILIQLGLLVGIGALVAALHLWVPQAVSALVRSQPIWLQVVEVVLVADIGFYAAHRAFHAIPFLWRFHSIHHSAEQLYFLISARAHPLDNVFIRLCGLIPAVILGVASPLSPTGSVVPALIILIATMWGFFIHSNLRTRLGPLEWIIATPGFHHWHHTMKDYRDHNYASMLPIMDWLFGTFYLPAKWPSSYGIEAKIPGSLGGQMIYPLHAEPASVGLSEPAEPWVRVGDAS